MSFGSNDGLSLYLEINCSAVFCTEEPLNNARVSDLLGVNLIVRISMGVELVELNGECVNDIFYYDKIK